MRKKGSTEKESREKRKGENIKEKKKLRKERESGKRMWERGNEDEEKE